MNQFPHGSDAEDSLPPAVSLTLIVSYNIIRNSAYFELDIVPLKVSVLIPFNICSMTQAQIGSSYDILRNF